MGTNDVSGGVFFCNLLPSICTAIKVRPSYLGNPPDHVLSYTMGKWSNNPLLLCWTISNIFHRRVWLRYQLKPLWWRDYGLCVGQGILHPNSESRYVGLNLLGISYNSKGWQHLLTLIFTSYLFCITGHWHWLKHFFDFRMEKWDNSKKNVKKIDILESGDIQMDMKKTMNQLVHCFFHAQ